MNTYLLVVESSQTLYFDILSPIIEGIPHKQLTTECTLLLIETLTVIPRLKSALRSFLHKDDSFYLFQLSHFPLICECSPDHLQWIREAMSHYEDDMPA